jgi:hypothetical protein
MNSFLPASRLRDTVVVRRRSLAIVSSTRAACCRRSPWLASARLATLVHAS